MNRRALERALRRHYTEKFRNASEAKRDRMRSGFQTSLFSWQGYLIKVRFKGLVFYNAIKLNCSTSRGGLKKLVDL